MDPVFIYILLVWETSMASNYCFLDFFLFVVVGGGGCVCVCAHARVNICMCALKSACM